MEYGNDRRDGGRFGGGGRRFGGGGGFNRGGNRGFSPVKVGDELEVTIEAVGAQGDGIAKKNGFVLFVPGAKEGDNVRIRITKVFRNMAFAEVIGEGSGEAATEGEEEPSEEESEEAPAEDDYDESKDSEEF